MPPARFEVIPAPKSSSILPRIPASYAVPTQGRAGRIGWGGRSPAWVENFGAAWRLLERSPRKRDPDDWHQIQGSIDAPAAGPQRYRLCSGPPKQADAVTNGQWLVSLNVRILWATGRSLPCKRDAARPGDDFARMTARKNP